jgi:hypothetical protein
MKYIFSIIIVIISCYNISGQSCNTQRYQVPITKKVNVYENITYSTSTPYNSNYGKDYKFDFYEPLDDTVRQRPLVIMLCGGDFQNENRKNSIVKTRCDSLASYGFTCAAVDYRSDYDMNTTASAERAVYRSVQDARAAIRYFKEFRSTFKIDTSLIFIGGDEAGAVAAIHTAFMTKENQRAKSTYGTSKETRDLGCLDCSGNPFRHPANVAGVINIRGKIASLDFLKSHNQIPVIHVNNEASIVNSLKTPLGILNMKNSMAIHNQMDRLNYKTEQRNVSILNDASMTATSLSTQIWNTAWKDIRLFLHKKITFQSPAPFGEAVACAGRPVIYFVKGFPNGNFCWEVNGGNIISQKGGKITVFWNYDAEKGFVRVTATNEAGITGAVSKSLEVELKEPPASEFSVHQITDNMVEVIDESSYGTFYTIDFGDDSSPSSGQIGGSVIHVYDYADKFLITQSLENTCGTSNNNYEIRVKKIETDSWELLKKNVSIIPEEPVLGQKIEIKVSDKMPYQEIRIKIYNDQKEQIYFEKLKLKNKSTIQLDANQLPVGKYVLKIMADSNSVNKFFEVK